MNQLSQSSQTCTQTNQSMEWLQPKRREPEWKQGWTSQPLTYLSLPPLPLLTIFGIVITLLWLSQHSDQKSQWNHTAINFQLFIVLLPILLVMLFVGSHYARWMLNFRVNPTRQNQGRGGGRAASGAAGSSPVGIAIFVLVLVMLVSYQSSFQSKWFGPLWS